MRHRHRRSWAFLELLLHLSDVLGLILVLTLRSPWTRASSGSGSRTRARERPTVREAVMLLLHVRVHARGVVRRRGCRAGRYRRRRPHRAHLWLGRMRTTLGPC